MWMREGAFSRVMFRKFRMSSKSVWMGVGWKSLRNEEADIHRAEEEVVVRDKVI